MFASKVPPADIPWTPPIVPMPLRPRSESPQPHCRPTANTCCSTTGRDYRIVLWREGRTCQHCRATVGVLQLRSCLPCRFSPDILKRKKKEKSETKAREQEVYVCRFCSESVRRSGAGALTFTSGGERMAIIPYRVELQLSPPAFRFRSDLRCPSPLSAIVSLPLPYHIIHYVIYTHWAVVSAQASYARFGNCICREKRLCEFAWTY